MTDALVDTHDPATLDRAERTAQALVNYVAAGGTLPARRLAADEARAIVGPDYDDEL